jgi:uncharacterized membrane protein
VDFPAFSQCNEGMEERIRQIEDQIANLQASVQTLIRSQTSSQPPASKVPTPPMTAMPAPTVSINRPSTSQQMFGSGPGKKTAVASSSNSASQLLPLVAVVCFVLAGVFLVRLAIEAGWLTPERQWGLLTLLGTVLVGAGRWMDKIDIDYRAYLSAAGIIVLYISAMSSALYFEILPQSFALILSMIISGLCLYLYQYHEGELFAILTTIGTYISPLLLGTKNDLIFTTAFFLIWATVFSVMSNTMRTRVMGLTAAYFGIGVYAMMHSKEADANNLLLIICVLVFQFMAFAIGVYQYSVQNKEVMTKDMAMAYLPILCFFYGTTYYFLNRFDPNLAPWISLIFAGFVYFLYWLAKKKLDNLQSELMVTSFLGVVLVHSGYLQILPDNAKPWLLPVFLLLDFISRRQENFPNVSPIVKRFLMAIGFLEFAKISYALAFKADSVSILPAVATVLIGGFYYFQGHKFIKEKTDLFLGLLHTIAILALYRIAYDYGSLAVSSAWGIYSGFILVFGYQTKDKALAKSSLVVLLITSLKALIYDASQAASIVRIGSLLLTGVVLYGAGLLFKQIKDWT